VPSVTMKQMHRIAHAPIWKAVVALWFLATGLAPGICAAMCSTNTCPTCAPSSSVVQTAAKCCGHCSKIERRETSELAAGHIDSCCCKNRKDIAPAATKPGKAQIVVVTGLVAVSGPAPLAIFFDGDNGPSVIPEHVAGAPPKVFLTCARARAPPIKRA